MWATFPILPKSPLINRSADKITTLIPSHIACILTGITKNNKTVIGIRGYSVENAAINPHTEPEAPTRTVLES